MAKKEELGCSGYLIYFLLFLFFINPAQAIIIVLVGIFIYWFIETNYKRIKGEGRANAFEKFYRSPEEVERRKRREKELERKAKVRNEEIASMERRMEKERKRMEKERKRMEKERFEAGFRENMSGDEYERYCKYILEQRGWTVNLTSKSGDQGVDLIASKEYLKVCIQCKRYSKPVGNKAVQEIFTGKQFYSGSHGVLVSSAGFTKSAISLASKTGIILLSDINLKNLESFL